MKILFIILPLLFMTGCFHKNVKDIQLVPVFMPVTCANFDGIESIKTLPVVFVQGIDTEGNQVLGLRGDQYSNLAINSAEALRYIKEQKILVSYYQDCIEHHNSLQNEKGPSE